MRRTRKVTPEGMLIKLLMSTNGLTSKELAGRIGKTEATICDVISGKNRSRKTLNRILDVLQEEQESEKMKGFLQLFKEQFGEANTLDAFEETDASM
ncbi:MAG: helix-turn-helix domain-containing protein [Clostridiales bacterium]|nr:helix-turn-helix domain-containing protein [Clostridiales bacterium]